MAVVIERSEGIYIGTLKIITMPEDTKEDEKDTEFAFKYYPDRRKEVETPPLQKMFFDSKAEYNRVCCERNVMELFKKHPLINILKGALKNAGCPVDLKRHVVCENCDSTVHGGYDAEHNQIIICKNVRKSRNRPEAVLIHELIHMYDHCVNEFNPKNLEHLACTEIRAANLTHCSFVSSLLLGQSSPINIKRTHRYCVMTKAAQSLMIARNISYESAISCILNVFDKCYNDLEPIGRRCRRASGDPKMAEEEAKCFLICDP